MEYFLSIVGFIPGVVKTLIRYFKFNLPSGKIFGTMIDNNKDLKIFVKDLFVPNNTFDSPKIFSKEGEYTQANPNISSVWPDVEAIGVAKLFNLLGRLGKKDKLTVVEMSKGLDIWNSDIIVLGAQAIKSLEFYKVMGNVGYSMDSREIYDKETNRIIRRESEYGYGLIIKAKNTTLPEGRIGNAILLGGFGVLGTQAAIHYFCNNIARLGKEFGKNNFSLIVRARISSGEQSAERLDKFTKIYN
ncbi:MAG: hypothetical protein WC458_02050 [Patescibacteria group bacterium]|jgi:hypothetical protein